MCGSDGHLLPHVPSWPLCLPKLSTTSPSFFECIPYTAYGDMSSWTLQIHPHTSYKFRDSALATMTASKAHCHYSLTNKLVPQIKMLRKNIIQVRWKALQAWSHWACLEHFFLNTDTLTSWTVLRWCLWSFMQLFCIKLKFAHKIITLTLVVAFHWRWMKQVMPNYQKPTLTSFIFFFQSEPDNMIGVHSGREAIKCLPAPTYSA